MTIGCDVSDLATNRADGTTRYTRELLKRLPPMASETMWHLFSPGEFEVGSPLPDNTKKILSPWPKYWTQLRLPFDIYKYKPDVLFMPIQQLPILRPKKTKTVVVVHDLAFHTFPAQFTRKDWLLLHAFTAQVAREADSIIAVSNATAADMKTYYGRTKNVHVVSHGVDHEKFRLFTDTEKQAAWQAITAHYPSLRKPYILYVGQIQPRKNLVRLIEAFEILHAKENSFQLVIAGGYGWKQKGIFEKAKNSPAKNSILLLGPVPDVLLPALYSQAQVFALVSLYEGFGMPIVEALACGTPVVTSNVSSMPEVAGDAATLVDPTSAQSIADGIRKAPLISLEKRLAQAQKFSWETTAQQTLQLLK